jgi:hypothetical protein
MSALPVEHEPRVVILPNVEPSAEIAFVAVRPDRSETRDPPGADLRALMLRAMSDLERERGRGGRIEMEMRGLDPEIMRGRWGCGEQH